MRHFTLGSLTSLFLILGVTPVGVAETAPTSEKVNHNSQYNSIRETEAFNLVSSGYRGDFKEQGIPAYAQFEQAYIAGNLDAEKLVNSAIEAGDLSSEAIEDEAYLNAITAHLDALTTQNTGR
ncbi:MAG: hypothetical protein ACLFQP_08705 [Halothece sp.]